MNHTAVRKVGLCLFATACLFSPRALALLDFDHSALTLDSEFGVRYDSNILASSNDIEDTIFNVAPTLTYRREGGRGSIHVSAGGDYFRYASESDRDHFDYHFGGNVTAPVSPDSPLSGDINASFSRSTSPNESIGDLVTTKSLNLGASGSYDVSERLGLLAGANYSSNKNNGFGDNETTRANVGLSFRQLLFRRLPLSISYSYSKSQSTDDPTPVKRLDTTTHAVNLATNGQLTAKIDGSVSFGFRSTDDKGLIAGSSRNGNGFVASTGLRWAYDELTNVSLGATKSLSVTADNESVDSTFVSLGLDRKLSEQLSGNLSVSQTWNLYRGSDRDDRLFAFGGGLSYLIRRNWTAGIRYNYYMNSSHIAAHDFARHVVNATLTTRF